MMSAREWRQQPEVLQLRWKIAGDMTKSHAEKEELEMEAYAAYVSGEKCKRLVEAANNVIVHRNYNAWAADRSNAMDDLASALAAVREGK